MGVPRHRLDGGTLPLVLPSAACLAAQALVPQEIAARSASERFRSQSYNKTAGCPRRVRLSIRKMSFPLSPLPPISRRAVRSRIRKTPEYTGYN